MMTNGPEAEVGDILDVPFSRPRDRKAVMEHPRYYECREYLITFLEERADRKPKASPESFPTPPGPEVKPTSKSPKGKSMVEPEALAMAMSQIG
jgi:hypothetical protein